MLILKNPLTLHSVSAMGIHSDSLGEKIRGNYQTFGARVTGEDLIHMTMQEPDIYVAVENNGPFLVEQQIQMDNQVRMELVNRLVNRLMFYDSPQFTYQDEVFVSTVLQKLGVTDVRTFMEQVKRHLEENKLAVTLLNRYFDAGREFAYTVERLLEESFSDRRELETVKNENRSERYLHNDIFKRLMTAECSNTIYSYRNQTLTEERAAESFQTLMWMRQADRIQLSRLRENIYQQENPVFFSDYFRYESTPLKAEELTREKIIGRMSAAILENIVNTAGYALQYEYGSTNVWKNYESVLYGSSEDALERFHYFQEQGAAGDVQLYAYTLQRDELMQDELHLTQLLEFAAAKEEAPAGEELYEGMRQSILLTMLENQSLQRQLTLILQRAQQAKAEPGPGAEVYYLEEKNQYDEEQNRFEAVYQLLQQKKSENHFSPVLEGEDSDKGEDVPEPERVFSLLRELDGENGLRERAGGGKTEIGERIREIVSGEIVPGEEAPRGQMPESSWSVRELLHRYADAQAEGDVPLMENRDLLEEINQHNLYMKQLLEGREQTKDIPRRVVVDRAQVREAALRALEDPVQVLREIYESGAEGRSIEPELISGMPEEIARILEVTDAGTRSYYERLLGYRREETPGRIAEMSGDYGDGQDGTGQAPDGDYPEKYRRADRTVLPEAESERLTEIREKIASLLRFIDGREQRYRSDTILQESSSPEQMQRTETGEQTAHIRHRTDFLTREEITALEREHKVSRQVTEISRELEKNVQMVHKTREQTEEELVEEVLERIGDSSLLKKTIEEKSEEMQLTRQHLEQIRRELIAQSREQITHLMEHNLKTQVHAISDMVYLEMERRLKNEQRRRGY